MRASGLLGRVVPKAAVAIYSIFVGAQVEAQTVTATPTRGEEGSLVVVSGTGWPRDDSVDISWQTKVSYVISSVPTDSGGNFIATLVVPKGAQGGPSVFSKKGLQDSHNIPILAGVSFNVQADSLSCADAYFIGLHGTGEGPDGDNQSLSTVIGETWRYFHDAAVRLNHNNVRGYAVDFAGSALAVLAGAAPGIGLVVSAAEDGKNKLTDLVNHIIEKNCRNPVVVLAGYSLRAWAIDRWISENYSVKLGISAPLPYVIDLVRGITLYGDPMWLHGDLGGVARRSGQTISSDPYTRILRDILASLPTSGSLGA